MMTKALMCRRYSGPGLSPIGESVRAPAAGRDLGQQQFAVGLLLSVQSRTETLDLSPCLRQCLNFGFHAGARIIFQLSVVAMQSGMGARSRMKGEVVVVEVLIHQPVPGTRRGRIRLRLLTWLVPCRN